MVYVIWGGSSFWEAAVLFFFMNAALTTWSAFAIRQAMKDGKRPEKTHLLALAVGIVDIILLAALAAYRAFW